MLRRTRRMVTACKWALVAVLLAMLGVGSAHENKDAGLKGRFIDRGAYVEDTQTGLLWQKDGASSGKMNFYEAANYAKRLKLGNVSGWRVPTAKELATIFPADQAPFKNSAYNKDKCCDGPNEFRAYWTCDLDKRHDDYAYVYQWYADGGANNCFASKNFVYVRCVRDTPAKARADLEQAAKRQPAR